MQNWAIILFFIFYGLLCFFVIKLTHRVTVDKNIFFKSLIRSFIWALFLGVGIMASGGEPGFALPAPNLIAIIVMLIDRLYQGVISGLIILAFWWVVIFGVMIIMYIIKRRK